MLLHTATLEFDKFIAAIIDTALGKCIQIFVCASVASVHTRAVIGLSNLLQLCTCQGEIRRQTGRERETGEKSD